jgi:hypothetical protein
MMVEFRSDRLSSYMNRIRNRLLHVGEQFFKTLAELQLYGMTSYFRCFSPYRGIKLSIN